MRDRFLQEYIGRIGMVTHAEIAAQAGVAWPSLHSSVISLLGKREIFLSRMDHGAETLLSRHLWFCLRAVCCEPGLLPDEQEIFDWLSDNEVSGYEAIRAGVPLSAREFKKAFRSLQATLCIAPIGVEHTIENPQVTGKQELSEYYDFLWVTAGAWEDGLYRPTRYRDLEYSLSELRRLLARRFSTREIDYIIYKSAR